jgi:hypothetical protein
VAHTSPHTELQFLSGHFQSQFVLKSTLGDFKEVRTACVRKKRTDFVFITWMAQKQSLHKTSSQNHHFFDSIHQTQLDQAITRILGAHLAHTSTDETCDEDDTAMKRKTEGTKDEKEEKGSWRKNTSRDLLGGLAQSQDDGEFRLDRGASDADH